MPAAVVLAAAAGAAAVGAYAPFGWWPLGLVALAALAALTRAVSPRRAALLGFVFGLAHFGAGVHWVYVSCQRYGGMPPLLAAAATALLVIYLALYPALAAYAARRLAGGTAYLLAALPGAWALAEGARAVVLTGFPWLALGYSQVDGPLAGLAPLIGVYGIGLVTALLGGTLVWMTGSWRRAALGALVVAVVLMGAWSLRGIAWTRPVGEPLAVALLQGNVSQLLKWDPAHLEHTLALYARLDGEQAGADLVVWPESAIAAFAEQLAPTYLQGLDARARAQGRALLIGMPARDAGGSRYYNSVTAFGTASGQYRKDHLVPFGEFVPFKGLLGRLLDILAVPLSDFSRGGADQPPLAADGARLGVSICYEVLFPREIARALPRATLLVNVSNDAWFGRTIAPHQHLDIARMRARETGRELVRATNTGITAVVDARGAVRARAPAFEVAVLRGEVRPHRGSTPYVRWGDAPTWLAAAGLLVLARRAGRRRPV